jgi:hypothetical protein
MPRSGIGETRQIKMSPKNYSINVILTHSYASGSHCPLNPQMPCTPTTLDVDINDHIDHTGRTIISLEGREMTTTTAKPLCLFTLAIITLAGCASHKPKLSWDLESSYRSNYGYSPDDPICIGYSGNMQKCFQLCDTYISCLRAKDNQRFSILMHATVEDPKHELEKSNFLGIPLKYGEIRGGLLDRFTIVSESAIDTLNLYFDMYHRDTLRVPNNLVFVPPLERKRQ